MVIVQARIPVQSERRNTALRHINDFVSQTRSEQGCMRCEAFVSLENPNVVVIQQTWRDADDLDQHASGAGLDTFLEALPLFIDGEVSTLRYDSAAEEDADEPVAEESVELATEDPAAVPAGVTLH
ncbi:MAG: putative quinol monooxygenase [Pseudomonadota bacterium]